MGGGTHTVTSHQHHQGRGTAQCHSAHLKPNRMAKGQMDVYLEICHRKMAFSGEISWVMQQQWALLVETRKMSCCQGCGWDLNTRSYEHLTAPPVSSYHSSQCARMNEKKRLLLWKKAKLGETVWKKPFWHPSLHVRSPPHLSCSEESPVQAASNQRVSAYQ